MPPFGLGCRARAVGFTLLLVAAVTGDGRLALADAAPARPAPIVSLVTMGPGDELFTRFGHAALRVTDPAAGTDLVYNYGTTSWGDPADLVARFLFAHVPFWVEVSTWRDTLAAYRADDRTIYLQALALDPAAARALASRLAWNARPENREYPYDHFRDNCSTRVRDLLDLAAGGGLRRAAEGGVTGLTYRAAARLGLHDQPLLLIAEELALGWDVDRPLTRWEAMFLPAWLRGEAGALPLADGRPLAGPPVTIYARRASPAVPAVQVTQLGAESSSARGLAGAWILASLGLGELAALASLVLLASLDPWAGAARRRRIALRAGGVVLALAALASALLGTAIWLLALLSVHAVLRHNANLLVLMPTDLYLVLGGGAIARGRPAPRRLKAYATARTGLVALIALAELLHWIPQVGLAVAAAGGAVPACALLLLAAERTRRTGDRQGDRFTTAALEGKV